MQPPQVYVMDMAGGEPRPVTEIPRGAGNPVWSPDGRTIAFASTSRPEELAPRAMAADEKKPRQSDVRVITEAVYRANGVAGSGYVDNDRPSQIWTVAIGAAASAPKQITSGQFASGNYSWSIDGTQIYFVA